ncbi:Lipase class 3 family protein [Seminavis robusta]|uniref:Lipase class 3 family protein n=1 Tax=Seminavis robusta TaxID=568900 RepID=A0A9N8D6V3_9STRA|nr:Lipase class 3 family protein [Seminavis robusta]|eukprot:Sro3_g002810.1 Lipase class 3 family protein (840) ;mRNA; f:248082-250703
MMISRQIFNLQIVGFCFILVSTGLPRATQAFTTTTTISARTIHNHPHQCLHDTHDKARQLWSAATDDIGVEESSLTKTGKFDLEAALFCSGLAFDSYVEPPSNSSRWERGSKGMDVAFVSNAFTRNLYKGLLQIQPIRAIGLPDEDDTIEGIATGGGTDAYLSVAVLEGDWKDDVFMLEKEMYHEGIRDLSGAAHVGRSSTAWSNVDETKSKQTKRNTGKQSAYHIKSGWGRDGQAVWSEDEDPFYLYLQDPATARLVFSIMDDDLIGEGSVVGSAHRRLTELIPEAKLTQQQLIENLKGELLAKLQESGGDLSQLDLNNDLAKVQLGARSWEGGIKMTSKPKKKDKKSQVAMGVAAGAAVAGPLGAAVGGVMANMYEGEVKGRIELKMSYLPLPPTPVKRERYTVLGGIPGITWGALFDKYVETQKAKLAAMEQVDDNNQNSNNIAPPGLLQVEDLEQCFFIKHSVTGGCCIVYRSLEKKLIVVSFRGTCEPKDLITDANLIQEAWVKGEDFDTPDACKVHQGIRQSMESISRRLKELILAAPAPGEEISDYDMIVTGHSLGGALSTMFSADIGEYGIDAGRALPQLAPSEPWWKSITNTIMGQEARDSSGKSGPPRPKSLRMYNFGSPRVGNNVFADRFDALLEDGRLDAAYRIVNGDDIVTRVPRTTSPLGVHYEHVGSTVMVSKEAEKVEGSDGDVAPAVWVEGESDASKCPVRDLDFALNSPLAEGTLLGDLLSATTAKDSESDQPDGGVFGRFSGVASKWSERVKTLKASDLASVVGIDRDFVEREFKIVESFAQGRALANHMEDDYYTAMGRAVGFRVAVGEEIIPLEEESA